jgi:hypothetical protein
MTAKRKRGFTEETRELAKPWDDFAGYDTELARDNQYELHYTEDLAPQAYPNRCQPLQVLIPMM